MAADQVDNADFPDLQQVSDDARAQLGDMLSELEGEKDIVIQSELMSLLNHVTPVSFLKR